MFCCCCCCRCLAVVVLIKFGQAPITTATLFFEMVSRVNERRFLVFASPLKAKSYPRRSMKKKTNNNIHFFNRGAVQAVQERSRRYSSPPLYNYVRMYRSLYTKQKKMLGTFLPVRYVRDAVISSVIFNYNIGTCAHGTAILPLCLRATYACKERLAYVPA